MTMRRWLFQDDGVLVCYLQQQTVETAGSTDRLAAVFTNPDSDHRSVQIDGRTDRLIPTPDILFHAGWLD